MSRPIQEPIILVVDDDPENIDILSGLLSDNYRVRASLTGEKALKIIMSDEQPDLVLLDVMMSPIDGFEVCKKIKQNHKTHDIPIIFITSMTTIEDKIHGFDFGAVDYITKPFEPREVLARIRTHIELKNARKTIKEYNENLERLLEKRTKELIYSERQAAFGQVVQGIVHNLNNPLTVSMGAVSLLNSELEEPIKYFGSEQELQILRNLVSESQKYLKIISHSTERINGIVQSLLAKSSCDKIEEMRIIDLNDIIRMELDFLTANLRYRHGLKKDIQLSSQSLMVNVVPGDISQIFLNLVGNALDAMHDTKNPFITIRTEKRSEQSVIIISDNGSGIPEENYRRIFDPFFTTKTPRSNMEQDSTKPIGTGLGLWMCKETVESYGGSIQFSSEMGRGTKFSITIPLYKESVESRKKK